MNDNDQGPGPDAYTDTTWMIPLQLGAATVLVLAVIGIVSILSAPPGFGVCEQAFARIPNDRPARAKE